MIVCNAADDDFKKIDYVVKPLANQRMVLVGNSKKPRAYAQGFYMLAVRTGLEPATPGVTGRYSNRLNYRTTDSVRYQRSQSDNRCLITP